MRRVVVYGGSFHPPHVGHAMVASWLRWTDQADEVWLVPTAHHAFGKVMAPLERRLRWCEVFARDVGDFVRVSAIEGSLPAPSYTLRTLDALAAAHPDFRFRLVVGADLRATVDRWHRWDRIEQTYAPIWVGRDGYPSVADTPTFPGVSSTEVRRRLAAGESVDGLLTAGVRAAVLADGISPDPA